MDTRSATGGSLPKKSALSKLNPGNRLRHEDAVIAPVQVTVWLPEELWTAVQALAPREGDTNVVILRAVEEYLLRSHRLKRRAQPGKYGKLVAALNLPVSALNLSARAASALAQMGVRYVIELVVLEPRELLGRRNFGHRSLGEVQEKVKALGLSLAMKLDDETYRGAVLATVAARIQRVAE